MARIHTHYDNLKVARDAPPEVIRAAYKTLSQKYHPDRHANNPEAIRVIQIINAAYDVLSDPVKRQEHDAWIARIESQENERRPAPSSSGHIRKKHSRKHHRHSPLARLQQQGAAMLSHALHRLRLLYGHFSRKLFRRT